MNRWRLTINDEDTAASIARVLLRIAHDSDTYSNEIDVYLDRGNSDTFLGTFEFDEIDVNDSSEIVDEILKLRG